MGLKRVADKIWTCASEGQCLGKGPTNPFGGPSAPLGLCAPHERFKSEDYSPRGRLYLCRLLNRNQIKPDENLVKVAYVDTACGFCDEVCTLKPLEAFRALREELVERGLAPPEPNKRQIENIMSKNNVFGGLSEARSRWAQEFNLPRKGEVLFFAGCYASYRQPETAKATVKLLRSGGVDVAYLGNDESCCGLPLSWNGDRRSAEEIMKRNFDIINESNANTVICSCAECYRTFKLDYKDLFGNLPFQVSHVSEILANLTVKEKIRFDQLNDTVTYHDPCFLGRHAKVYDAPRKVLQKIPGVELVEMERTGQWAFCCGSGAGIVQAAYPDFSRWSGGIRLAEAKKAANTIVTSCPRCIENLKDTAEKEQIEVNVYDLPVYVAKALK